jgi:hypothetical protein
MKDGKHEGKGKREENASCASRPTPFRRRDKKHCACARVVPFPSVALLTENLPAEKEKETRRQEDERKKKKRKKAKKTKKEKARERIKRVWGGNKTTHFGALRGFLPSTMQTWPPARHRRQVLSAGSVRMR